MTTTDLSPTDVPLHGNFIVSPNEPYDWRTEKNDYLWQGGAADNNPCPPGWRVPTEAEWDAERLSWNSDDSAGAYASPLKLPAAGGRVGSSGSLGVVGSYGYYWSSTVGDTGSRGLAFYSAGAFVSLYGRANGISVRCLKD